MVESQPSNQCTDYVLIGNNMEVKCQLSPNHKPDHKALIEATWVQGQLVCISWSQRAVPKSFTEHVIEGLKERGIGVGEIGTPLELESLSDMKKYLNECGRLIRERL